jgi:hypothetical protein
MAARGPRHSKEEFAKRGEAIFEKEIRPNLSKQNPRHFLAIDIETGAYEIDANDMAACDRLEARVPDAQIWLRRVGSRFARKFDCKRNAIGPSQWIPSTKSTLTNVGRNPMIKL